MSMSRRHHRWRNLGVLGIALLVVFAWWPSRPAAQQQDPSVALSADFGSLGGQSPSGAGATLVVPRQVGRPAAPGRGNGRDAAATKSMLYPPGAAADLA